MPKQPAPPGPPAPFDPADPEAYLAALRRPLGKLPDPLPMRTLSAVTGNSAPRFRCAIMPPGSKSLSNRALLIAALAEGDSIIKRPLLDADDAKRMLTALRSLGVATEVHPKGEFIVVRGVGGELKGGCELFLNNAGTATRFLTAAAVLATGPVTIDGNERMRERPLGELIAMLRELGAEIEELGEPGFVPIRVHGTGTLPGGAITIPTTQSSQFVSALVMVAPWFEQGLTIHLEGEVTSGSYIEMTTGLLAGVAGAEINFSADGRTIAIAPGGYGCFEYEVEPDASGATYLWGAAALFPGSLCRVPGMHFTALQHDARFPMVLRRMGCPIEYSGGSGNVTGAKHLSALDEADLSQMPDTAMTLAAVAAFADGPTRITGLKTLRVKETDRIAAIAAELSKIGCTVDTADDQLTITPPTGGVDCSDSCPPVHFDTYDDHRMAMSLSLIGLRRPNVFINDPACVQKTYAPYWSDLAKIYEACL